MSNSPARAAETFAASRDHPPRDLDAQHLALANRIAWLFERNGSSATTVTPVGHCVLISHSRMSFVATISGAHLLLLNSADQRTLGRFSTPAGLCRHIVTLARN